MMDVTRQVFDPLVGWPVSISLIAGVTFLYCIWFIYDLVVGEKPISGFPIVSLDRKALKSSGPAHSAWQTNARDILKKGMAETPGCFQVLTGTGYKLVVPSRFAYELRNDPNVSFNEAFAKDIFIHYPGFEPHRQGLENEEFIPDLVRVKLTQSLGLITDDLVEETDLALADVLGNDKEWKTRLIKQDLLDIVSRLSSRVFGGKQLCRNPDWLQIAKNYTVDSFMAARELRACYPVLRPIQHWFMPTCKRLRQEVRDARRLINKECARRATEAEKAIQAGGKSEKTADAIGWMVEMSHGRQIDFVAGQLGLGMVAIHTTSETSSNCIFQLCETPEVAEELRKEVIEVLTENGWSKTSLYKMKLLDSFLKEVMRTNGLADTTMNRMVKKDIVLSDGTVIKAGTRFMVTDEKCEDPKEYPEPAKFDVARFMRMREKPGEENRHQFVTPSPELMGFGYGQHACPGRFFVSNELKIALAFLLLRYDFRYDPEIGRPEILYQEQTKSAHPFTKVQVRRRTEEIDLLAP